MQYVEERKITTLHKVQPYSTQLYIAVLAFLRDSKRVDKYVGFVHDI